jgi:uncharacterized protein YukE
MPEPLRVDPVDLFRSSDQLAMHRADHIEVHDVANASIESALNAGWVGSSAAALQGKLPHLQRVTSHISGELERHRDAFRQSGHSYQDTDADSAVDINSQHDVLDGDHAR